MSRGLFITFEGGEGTGKTTQIARLAERLRGMGRRVVITLEPGGTRLGEEIRCQLVRQNDDTPVPAAELLLYGADRAHHVQKLILPALEAGDVVLCDRYADATEAYQGWGRGLEMELIQRVNEIATGGLWPDRTLWLDLDPEVGVRRSLARQADRGGEAESRFEFEHRDFHERVRQGYGAICRAYPGRVRRVDADGGPDDVEARVWAELAELFSGAGEAG